MPISASIEIAASPKVVRAKFLDFSSLPTYHKGFFGSITALNDNLDPGSKLRVVFQAAGQTIRLRNNQFNPVTLLDPLTYLGRA
ncbi:hypothetical protein A1F97_10309 [Pyrenophora tritici-repentis]|nr:hypothetical protein PtrSN001A_010499 [Pyrenophora tritici-repentis]PZC89448.1 hypothetical protein A1F95_10281 [Pyrenophora tritici-repentis]PZD23328.1 hypothetical protein A1F96_10343 [Pyrenophora tritici-repentis]PZD29594.1 hypothetical protein A1F97_10309 [Pyrenophora tritici-repentis]